MVTIGETDAEFKLQKSSEDSKQQWTYDGRLEIMYVENMNCSQHTSTDRLCIQLSFDGRSVHSVFIGVRERAGPYFRRNGRLG